MIVGEGREEVAAGRDEGVIVGACLDEAVVGAGRYVGLFEL